ncbi:MAG: TIM barrel protein [Phycisphaerales bacterium]|nr:TIM barrel protein [Phycisphaerae bacterium]NNF42883.1 TIM barrel protein [Phycisphaerales bacterium]NNM26042.1 TIM barrel protein [Phycisphaerales bacterium]
MPLPDLRDQALVRDRDAMLRHLQTFELDLKFSAGIWFFSPPGSRFHERYQPERTIEERLAMAAPLADDGLAGIEAHYPNEISEDNLDLWRGFARDTGIRIITVIPLLFWDRDFEWGSLSNPDDAVRRRAIERTERALALNRELDTDFAVVWPGIDGYENGFGLDFRERRTRFAAGLAEAMDTVPGVRIAFEPKPYEPRGRILFGTTPEGVLLGHQVESMLASEANGALLAEGHCLCGMNPEIGHMLMGFEDVPYALSWPLGEGRLAHTHWNSQPLGNYDQDLNVGVISPEQTEAGLYTLKMHGYDGSFGIDINPERMPVETALRISMDAMRAANDRINGLDHASILYAHDEPTRSRGWLEAYLIRQRAPHGTRLTPLPPPGER